MKTIFNFFILVLVLVATSSAADSISTLVSMGTPDLNAVTCGGRSTASYGEVTYKPFDIAEPNERCVWVLRTNSATYARVTLTNLDTPGSVSVLALGRTNQKQEWIPKNGETTYLYYANVLIVTFHTGPKSFDLGRGFVLNYQFYTAGSYPKASTKSMDYINVEDIGHIKYPATNTSYDNNELAVMVFAPYFNRFDITNKLRVVYVKSSLQSTDYVQVYNFNQTWKMLGKITKDVDAISGSDMIMLVFQSDASMVYSGFQVTYTQSSKCVCPVNQIEDDDDNETTPWW